MTPGERRRRFRKHAREDGWEHFKELPITRQQLEALPHPRIQSPDLSAWDYVSWCIDNGHTAPAFNYLRSL